MERAYNEKLIRKQVLSALEMPKISEKKLTFSITYYPAFQNVRSLIDELYILITPNKEHKKVFPNVPIVGFQNGKNLKDYSVRAKLPQREESGR